MSVEPDGPWGIVMSRALPLLIAIALVLLPVATSAARAESDLEATSRRDVLERLNRLRGDRGLRPLRMAGNVGAVAMDRSSSMKRRDYFGHVSPGGKDAGDLLRSRGVAYRHWGEIIGMTPQRALGAGSRKVVARWRHSPTHRRIVLSRRFRHVGVGVVRDGRRTLWTVVFVE